MAGPGRFMVPSLRIPDETSVEVAHLSTLAADVIEALPNSLTRSMSDLKELDAVLGASLEGITEKLNKLLNLIYDETVSPQERLILLKEVAEDVVAFKLGGEDKIRVATGTCETILQHSAQLDMIASLLSSLMPPWIVATMPASSTPSGYPELFPTFAAAANTATAHIARPRGDFFLPPGAHPSGSAAQSYASAVEAVNAYRAQGRLQPLKSQQHQQHNKTARPAKRSAPGYSSADKRFYGEAPVKRRKQVSDVDDASTSQPTASSSAMAQSVSQMSAPSPDKGKRRGGPKKQTSGASPDVSAAPTPTLPQAASSRQPRRRAAQTSYYADDDEEEASAPEEASPEPEESAEEPIAHAASDNAANLNAPRPAAVKKRSADNNATVVQAPELPHEEEEEEDVGAGGGDGALGGREKLYCYCQSVSYGEMIGCDNDDCEREWFHLDCLGLKQAPSGTWYCDECKAAMGNNNRRASRR